MPPSPFVVDGDTTLMESCAILVYLGERHPSPLLPEDDSRWKVIQYLFWQLAIYCRLNKNNTETDP